MSDADSHTPRIVIVGGDTQAITALCEAFAREHIPATVVEIAYDPSHAEISAEIDRMDRQLMHLMSLRYDPPSPRDDVHEHRQFVQSLKQHPRRSRK